MSDGFEMGELAGKHLTASTLSGIDRHVEVQADAARGCAGYRRIDILEAAKREADPVSAFQIGVRFQIGPGRRDIPDTAINDLACVCDFRSQEYTLPCGDALILSALRLAGQGRSRIGHVPTPFN